MVDTLASAKAYAHAGLSVIPVRTDGTKAPALTTWKQYQVEAANDDQVDRWFAGTANGVAIVWGKVSGNGEVIDFDVPGLYDLFAQECSDQGLSHIVEGMPLIETPSGGRHLVYRCSDGVGRNQKLAERLVADGAVETLIETRGEGGYTIAPGSPEACHPDRRPYRFLRGQSLKIPVISAAERSALLSIATSFNEYVKPSSIRGSNRPSTATGALRPGDDFNLRGDVEDILKYVAEHGIELVIFDTARRCFSVRDENDNAEFYARIVPTLDAFKQAGIATLTFGHPAKHDVGRARGAGAQEDAGDVNLSLTLYSGDIGSPEATILLKATKNRILGLGTPHLYLRRAGNDRFERVERPVDGNEGKERPPSISAKTRCAADVKEHLQARHGERVRRAALDEALKPMGHSESTIDRTLRELLGQGLIDKDAAGYVWLDGST